MVTYRTETQIFEKLSDKNGVISSFGILTNVVALKRLMAQYQDTDQL